MIILAISGTLALHIVAALIVRRWILSDVRRKLGVWQDDIQRRGR
ncbi:hypothetical protein DSM110277_02042 [Sulfitobacter pontiacus]|uniref:Uncharacterized protein n=1 Tax=Sulfitobacter pontiacus TaxID=60137 RepID=A0AAX3ABI7_9RHOB|nr:hypothetical protein [Sulfitobacter pontiacus]UOA23613.1 hypothetical protein DSM110277_02042 [Sulfitobacter pontiacus]